LRIDICPKEFRHRRLGFPNVRFAASSRRAAENVKSRPADNGLGEGEQGRSLAGWAMRARLLAGFALICLLLAAILARTAVVMSDRTRRIKRPRPAREPAPPPALDSVGSSVT